MIKFLLLHINLIMFVSIANAQHYSLINGKRINDSITADIDISRNIAYKFNKEHLFFFVKFSDVNDSNFYKLSTINIETGKIVNNDTIGIIDKHFYINDIVVLKDKLILIGYDNYYVYSMKSSKKLLKYHHKNYKHRFTNGFSVKDNVLLYATYDFHPLDGGCGTFLNLLDIKTCNIYSDKLVKHDAIALASMNKNWLTRVKSSIYIFSPLICELDVYDMTLNLERNIKLSILDNKELEINKSLQKKIDSTHTSENLRITNALKLHVNKYGSSKGFSIASDYYDKNYVWEQIQKVRKENVFIEKVFNVFDSLVGISLSRPEYHDKFRDFIIWDPVKQKIINVYSKWRCKPNDIINSYEDYFTINLQQSEKKHIHFYKGYIYTVSLYDIDNISYGTAEQVEKKYYKNIVNKGYSINILKYKFSS